MSNNTPKDRFYIRPPKPVADMTEEELDAFAEEVYERIMGTLPDRDETDTK